MPLLKRKYKLSKIKIDELLLEVETVFKDLKAEQIVKNKGTVSGAIPSIWGWGGMKIDFSANKGENSVNAELSGYIAQLATSPLEKVLDQFEEKLTSRLQQKYKINLPGETNTNSMSVQKTTYTKIDRRLIIIVLLVVFGMILVDGLSKAFGSGYIAIIIAPALGGLGYYFGRKYLYSNKK